MRSTKPISIRRWSLRRTASRGISRLRDNSLRALEGVPNEDLYRGEQQVAYLAKS
jgi:hypothetical protein